MAKDIVNSVSPFVIVETVLYALYVIIYILILVYLRNFYITKGNELLSICILYIILQIVLFMYYLIRSLIIWISMPTLFETTLSKIESFTQHNTQVIVVTASWCVESSKFLSNTWSLIQSELLKNNLTQISFLKYDIDLDSNMLDSVLPNKQVKQVPTLFVKNDNSIKEYIGDLYNIQTIIDFITSSIKTDCSCSSDTSKISPLSPPSSSSLKNQQNGDDIPIIVALVKASWCGACNNYLSTDQWNALRFSRSFEKNVTYTMYDIDDDRDLIMQDIGVDTSTIKYVPTLYVKVGKYPVVQYKGSIYDNSHIQEFIKTLI